MDLRSSKPTIAWERSRWFFQIFQLWFLGVASAHLVHGDAISLSVTQLFQSLCTLLAEFFVATLWIRLHVYARHLSMRRCGAVMARFTEYRTLTKQSQLIPRRVWGNWLLSQLTTPLRHCHTSQIRFYNYFDHFHCQRKGVYANWNSPLLVFCSSAVGPFATVYMPGRETALYGLRLGRHWHRDNAQNQTRAFFFAHRSPNILAHWSLIFS